MPMSSEVLSMAISFQEIKARYSRMKTRELVALFLSNGLTDDAKQAAGQIFEDIELLLIQTPQRADVNTACPKK
jgi:hypothetical protein